MSANLAVNLPDGRDLEIVAILSVYNRQPIVLHRTLMALVNQKDKVRLGLVIVDDGSDEEFRFSYRRMRDELKTLFPLVWLETSTLKERPETYHINGHNNPAYCTNLAIEEAAKMGAERLLLLSSDIVLDQNSLSFALKHSPDEVVVGQTMDSNSHTIFCRSDRIWPMCWFVLAGTGHIAQTKFDEEYLKGMAFEDNDFMGRMLLRTERMVIDDTILCLHQTHAPTAYSDHLQGFQVSEEYTKKKWGGVPFRPNDSSLTFNVVLEERAAVLTNPNAPHLEK